jgi:hypothetical protein
VLSYSNLPVLFNMCFPGNWWWGKVDKKAGCHCPQIQVANGCGGISWISLQVEMYTGRGQCFSNLTGHINLWRLVIKQILCQEICNGPETLPSFLISTRWCWCCWFLGHMEWSSKGLEDPKSGQSSRKSQRWKGHVTSFSACYIVAVMFMRGWSQCQPLTPDLQGSTLSSAVSLL